MSVISETLSTFFFLLSSLLLPLTPARPPTETNALLRYVPANADVVFTVDLGAFAGNLMKSLGDLQKKPFVAYTPQLARQVGAFHRGLLRNLQRFEQKWGINPVRSVEYMTLAMVLTKEQPLFLWMFHGKFPETTKEKFAKRLRIFKEAEKKGSLQFYFSSQTRRLGLVWSADGFFAVGHNALLRQIGSQVRVEGTGEGNYIIMFRRLRLRRSPQGPVPAEVIIQAFLPRPPAP